MYGHRVGREELVAPAGRSRSVRRGLIGLLAATALLTVPLWGQSEAQRKKAVIVPIHGVISDILRDSVDRRINDALANHADTIVFEMRTPGGMVTSALAISKLIKKLPDKGVHTVAWVNDEAFSAGALISVAAQEIVMSSTASIGDCAPIIMSPTGDLESLGDAERAKAESPVLQEFRDSAARNGYDALLCRAMVTVGEEVWWVENSETGERSFVGTDRKNELVDGVATRPGQTSTAPAEQPGRWRLVTAYVDPVTGREVPAKQPTDTSGELLTLSQSEAVAYGLAKALVPNVEALQAYLGLPGLPQYDPISSWEKFAMWLNSPLIRGLLFILVLMGAYMEFHSPGLIVPGVVAAIALIIFLGAPYVAGLANIWTILLLVVGLILLAVEIFLIPGFGVVGVLGALLVLVSLIATFVPAEPGVPAFSWPSMDATWNAIKTGILVISSSTIIALIGLMLIARYLPTIPGARRLLLDTAPAESLALSDPYPDVAHLGDIGVVVGDLRPGGQARFGMEIVDVSSQGEYVDAGRRVQVIKRVGASIVVRPLADET